MKYLFVGDIHNHQYMFEDIERLDQKYNFSQIIFFGDYIDDWNTDNHDSLKTLEKVFQLKQSNPLKYTFLLGNHELSYLGYRCSGHCNDLEEIVSNQLALNIDMFDLATSVNCNDKIYICSHAGFTNAFIKELLPDNKEYHDYDLYYKLVEMNKDKAHNLEPFSHASYIRGGRHENSSCLWCDKREHSYFNLQKPLIPYQIVGHTPVKTIIEENGIYFIDTHSTYQDGSEYGDKSYLMWNEDKFEIIY